MTKIGLLSDVHAAPLPLLDALRVFREEEVATILCAGDIAGYGNRLEQTVELLVESSCRSIAGNHDLWFLEDDLGPPNPTTNYLRHLPTASTLQIQGKKIFMVHASPPDSMMDGIRLLDEKGLLVQEQKVFWQKALAGLDADILVVGHTHQVFAERFGDLLVINPGSCLFNHTCAILTLPTMKVDFHPLCGKEPILSWNFSMFKGSLEP